MFAEHIERASIDWPDWNSRFSGDGEVRTVFVNPQAERMVIAESTTPRRGRKPTEGCGAGEHYWISKGEKQVTCKNCPRTILRTLLPEGTVVHTQARGHRASTHPMPDKPVARCPITPNGVHRWLSKGVSRVRCQLCKMTAKRKMAA